MDKSSVRKNGRRRKIDSRKARTSRGRSLQEALIEKNHFEESLNLPEYPRKPLAVRFIRIARDESKRKREMERERWRKGERERKKERGHRMKVGGSEYYA